jgi:membrane protein required for colicin V production
LQAEIARLVWVDWCILGLIAVSALIGLVRGLLREAFSLGLWGCAIWVGMQYSGQFSAYLDRVAALPSARVALAFAILFLGTLMFGGMLIFLLGKLIETAGLSGTDRLAGMLFGVARGMLFTAVLVLLAGLTPLPQDPWWKASKLIPPFQSLALWLRGQLPQHLANSVKFP